jgi:hypothetical protein
MGGGQPAHPRRGAALAVNFAKLPELLRKRRASKVRMSVAMSRFT